MASPRSDAGTSLTRSPPISISPELGCSSPAIRRSKVDLPQPDGPTNTTNSPSSISRSTPWMTRNPPKDLATDLRARLVMDCSIALVQSDHSFHPGIGDAGGNEALQEHEYQGHRQQRHHGHRQQIVPLGLQLALERVQTDLQCVAF